MDFRKNFSERFAHLRQQQSVSLGVVAEFLGVTSEAVRLLEKGSVHPVSRFCAPLRLLRRIA